jgi:hypothetical protein
MRERDARCRRKSLDALAISPRGNAEGPTIMTPNKPATKLTLSKDTLVALRARTGIKAGATSGPACVVQPGASSACRGGISLKCA